MPSPNIAAVAAAAGACTSPLRRSPRRTLHSSASTGNFGMTNVSSPDAIGTQRRGAAALGTRAMMYNASAALGTRDMMYNASSPDAIGTNRRGVAAASGGLRSKTYTSLSTGVTAQPHKKSSLSSTAKKPSSKHTSPNPSRSHVAKKKMRTGLKQIPVGEDNGNNMGSDLEDADADYVPKDVV